MAKYKWYNQKKRKPIVVTLDGAILDGNTGTLSWTTESPVITTASTGNYTISDNREPIYVLGQYGPIDYVTTGATITASSTGFSLDTQTLRDAMTRVEEQGMTANTMLMNPRDYDALMREHHRNDVQYDHVSMVQNPIDTYARVITGRFA